MSITDQERAFYDSDSAWDGRFVVAVRTTGIYCRPSCRVRQPPRKNIPFLPPRAASPLRKHISSLPAGESARAAGYRACLRCHPDDGATVTIREISTPIGRMTIGATDTALVPAGFTHRRTL